MTTVYEIGPFRLEPEANVLTRGGVAAPLGPRAVAVLRALIERANEYVPKAQIIEAVWPDVVVEEGNLAVQIAAIRRALSHATGEHWIKTLPRRGYRFVGPVAVSSNRRAELGTDACRRSNLPKPLTSFIGRERELSDIERFLSAGRLLTIVGVGGIGKTRLALKAAGDVMDSYADGVWFVDFAAFTDPAFVPTAVAQVLGIRELARKPLIETLSNYLQRRQLLLILDNCEHLLPACASLADAILRDAAALAIIATSREPLQISAEQIYVVQSLSLPDRANADAIASSDAVRLFVERAERHWHGFALTPQRAPIVAELCIQLDGIPLALELAAARINSLSVEQIYSRLDDRFRLLTDGGRTVLPRQQTLRATFDWSFDLLSEEERAVLRRLSVFAGGFTLDAASAILSDSAIDAHAVIDVLRQLVLRSLVIANTNEAVARYRLLETTRAYAFEKLAESDETTAIRRRHAEYFCDRFEAAGDDWLRLPDAEWHAAYTRELDNIRVALELAFGPCGDSEIAVSLAVRSRPLWSTLPLNEGRHWLEAALGHVGERTSLSDQARLWSAVGTLLTAAEPTRAAAALERGVELYRRIGDLPALGKSLLALGRVRVFMRRSELAAAALEEAYPLVERDGLPKTLARYFETFALLEMITGDTASARGHLEKALLLNRKAGAESYMLSILVNLADITWAMGDLDAALAGFREAIAMIRRSSTNVPKDMLGLALTNLVGVHTERGELAEALAVAKEGLPLRQDEVRHDALDHLALRAALAGRLSEASRLAGFLDYWWTARQATRQPNEARAHDRLHALRREKIPPVELESLLLEGARLSEEEATKLALDDVDSR